MATFTGYTPASDYGCILNVGPTGGAPGLTNVLRVVQDAFGNNTIIQLSTIAMNVMRSAGTFEFDGVAVTALSVDINSMSAPNPIALGNEFLRLPIGDTSQRPIAPVEGDIRFNSELLVYEGYANGAWDPFTVGGVTSILGTANQIVASAAVGNVTLSLADNAIMPGTGGLTLPQGSTANRAGGAGTLRFNTQTALFEGTNDGVVWNTIPTIDTVVTSVTGTASRITATPTVGDVIVDIDAGYVGQTSITTLGTVSTGTWQGTIVDSNYGGTGVDNNGSTITIGGNTSFVGAFTFAGTLTGNTGVTFPTSGTLATTGDIPSGAELSATNDTNVTLTLGGSPLTALVNAASITAGWTGTLAETRGGTAQSTYLLGDTLYSSAANTLAKLAGNITTAKQYLSQTGTGAVSAAPVWSTVDGGDITGAALSKVDDTNVTLTLGGTPLTSLLRAASITAGWAGQLSVARGGTGLSAASNSATLVSTSAGVPVWSSTMTNGQLIIGSTGATPVAATLTQGAGITITNGAGTITIAGTGGTVTSVSGTTNQINSTGGTTPVLSLSSTLVAPGTVQVGSITLSSTTITSSGQLNLAGTGNPVFTSSNFVIGNAATLNLFNAGNTFGSSFSASAQVSGVAYTLPPAAPTVANQALVCTGAGVMTWGTEAGRLIGMQSFGAGATYTPTTGTAKVRVKAWGGGGGGGTANLNTLSGVGGGGGAYVEAFFANTASATITIGGGGNGGAANNGSNGQDGGATSFGTTLIAAGGKGGASGSAAGIGGAVADCTVPSGGGFAIAGARGGDLTTVVSGIVASGGGSFGSEAIAYPTIVTLAPRASTASGGPGGNLSNAGSAGAAGLMIIYEYS